MVEKSQNRQFFRIEYPRSERPTLHLNKKQYVVLDVSEQGICFEIPVEHGFQAGDRIIGRIDFCKRTQVDIRGSVLRLSEASCAVTLSHHLPLPLIMSEQRYLFANFQKKSS
mgnify:CR=1 FL=1